MLRSSPTNTITILNELEDNKIKTITNTVDFLTTGYKIISPNFQFGKWWDTFNYNDLEGSIKCGFSNLKV